MSNYLNEQQVLQKLDIPDFRHMTKAKVMEFASMIQSMDPEVAKKALEQFPAFSKMALEALQDYKEEFKSVADNNKDTTVRCLDLLDNVIDGLKACAAKDDLSFEERSYYVDKMMEVAHMVDQLDERNKTFNWKMLMEGAAVVVMTVGGAAALLGGNININIPKLR